MMSESAKEAARRLAAPAIKDGFVPEALHTYHDREGEVLHWRIRAKHQDGRKWIRPMRANGDGFELGEPKFTSSGKPLYNLHRIATAPTGCPIWICEGEKSADALDKLGAIATTSGGAQSAAVTDWTPLRGRDCRLWADNDDAGKTYMGDVAAILQGFDCKLSSVDVDLLGLQPKGDAADWLQAHPNAKIADVEALPRVAAAAGAPPAEMPIGGELVVLRASDIAPQPIRWLWRDRIALGKVTLIAGDPGLGKSLVTIALAAHVTTGRSWPVDASPCEVGDVILMSAEDDAADTLRPRLDEAGSDVRRVAIVKAVCTMDRKTGKAGERMFSLRHDLDAVRTAARRLPACRMIVIDPISAYLDGTESHNNAEVRAVLAPLAALAADLGVAIVCVTHLNKGTQSSALYRTTGSLAFVAAARAAFAVTRDKDNAARRLILPMKNNLAQDVAGVAYTIVAPHGVPAIAWESDPVTITADEALASEQRGAEGASDRPERDEAVNWLRAFLADGPRGATETYAAARAVGISRRTLRRAHEELSIDSYKEGFGPLGTWLWRLEDVHAHLPNMPTGQHSEDPHETGLPAKASTGHDKQDSGGQVSGIADDEERF